MMCAGRVFSLAPHTGAVQWSVVVGRGPISAAPCVWVLPPLLPPAPPLRMHTPSPIPLQLPGVPSGRAAVAAEGAAQRRETTPHLHQSFHQAGIVVDPDMSRNGVDPGVSGSAGHGTALGGMGSDMRSGPGRIAPQIAVVVASSCGVVSLAMVEGVGTGVSGTDRQVYQRQQQQRQQPWQQPHAVFQLAGHRAGMCLREAEGAVRRQHPCAVGPPPVGSQSQAHILWEGRLPGG